MTAADKFDKILGITQLDLNDFAMECRIIPNTLKAAIKRDAITSDIITKIHDRFGVRKGFFDDGEDPVLEEKHTPVQNEAAIAGKSEISPEEVYRRIVEGNTEYILIPRVIFEDKYKMVAVEKIQQDKRIIEWLLGENEKYSAKLLALDPQPAAIEKGKEETRA